MEDLWPDFLEVPPDKTPISIIKEYASKLEEKTNFMVSAEVEKEDNIGRIEHWENDSFKGYINPPLQYSFFLVAHALNYRYKLFSIAHDIFLYPVYFYEIDKDIKDEFYLEQKNVISIHNETDLLAFIKNVFGAKKTIKIIRALISQVS